MRILKDADGNFYIHDELMVVTGEAAKSFQASLDSGVSTNPKHKEVLEECQRIAASKKDDEFDAEYIAQEKSLEKDLKGAARSYLRVIEGDTSLEVCATVGEHLKSIAIMWAQMDAIVKGIEKRRASEPRRK